MNTTIHHLVLVVERGERPRRRGHLANPTVDRSLVVLMDKHYPAVMFTVKPPTAEEEFAELHKLLASIVQQGREFRS